MKLNEIAKILGGELRGDPEIEIKEILPVDEAKSGSLCFVEKAAYLEKLKDSGVSAVLLSKELSSQFDGNSILVEEPRKGLATLLPHFSKEPSPSAGIHPSAVIEESATVSDSAYVGPHCYVGHDSIIGDRSILMGGVHVSANCSIGQNTKIFPNTTIYHGCRLGNRVRVHANTVIGSDGFGYVMHNGEHQKIHQIGGVEIHDDVEIGAGCTIDRGALGTTKIGQGTKIDNLVQIGHNVEIGQHSILVAQVGVAGSTKMGKYVIVAGQAGISGHLKIGDQVTIGGNSGVTKDLPSGSKVMGYPAFDHIKFKRASIIFQKLPELFKKLKLK